MNATPFVIGAILVVVGVLFIVFRKPIERARDGHLRNIGDHTALTVQLLHKVKMTIVTGSILILSGLFAIVAGIFPFDRT